jgi:replicative DNA helicase
VIVTTESPPARWLVKLIASMVHVPSDRIESGALSQEEIDMVRDAYDRVKRMKLAFLDAGAPTVAQVRATVLTAIRDSNAQWCLIDSISKMTAPGASGIYERTAIVNDGIQALYREADIPILVTSQVGRDVSGRAKWNGKGVPPKMPKLDDGYGGGVIEQNAGVVMALYNHHYYVEQGLEDASVDAPQGTALLRLLKSRWTPGARTNAVMLTFVGGAGFYEMARDGGR